MNVHTVSLSEAVDESSTRGVVPETASSRADMLPADKQAGDGGGVSLRTGVDIRVGNRQEFGQCCTQGVVAITNGPIQIVWTSRWWGRPWEKCRRCNVELGIVCVWGFVDNVSRLLQGGVHKGEAGKGKLGI